MMRRVLSVLLYRIYSLTLGRSISEFLEVIKTNHDQQAVITNEGISAYLQQFGIMDSFENLPLITKKDISAKLITIDPAKIHSYAYTGGSYGEPFKIPYSKERANVRTASFTYFNEIAGYKLGDPFLMIAAKEKPNWWQFLRNEYRFVPKDLSESKIRETVNLLVEKEIKVIIGFPSVVYELAAFIATNPVKHSVKAIIFTSEPSDEARRIFIKSVFSCQVTDRYSNEEVGLIAQQKEFGGVYYTNCYNVVVEILDENNHPVKPGEAGKVVVTDLKADLFPFLRYDTGDIAVAQEYKNGRLLALKSISGRITEKIFNAEGDPIAALSLGPLIHKPLTENNLYNQFQFAQTGKTDYELRMKSIQAIPANILNKIKDNLQLVLGVKANVTVVLVDDIKPQKSGKRPIYKNEWQA